MAAGRLRELDAAALQHLRGSGSDRRPDQRRLRRRRGMTTTIPAGSAAATPATAAGSDGRQRHDDGSGGDGRQRHDDGSGGDGSVGAAAASARQRQWRGDALSTDRRRDFDEIRRRDGGT
ncbi:hypothetical protein Scep_001840 [Stephania cephalantha]|uniref:Uncharacterized protein n=1 Tax=Stephania cephalantha TaxID=152367 RepID=A0AAP0LCS8_9MAGN